MISPTSRSFLAIFGLAGVCMFASQQALKHSESNLQGKRILFLVAEREYGTEKSLTAFANSVLTAKGAICDFAFARSNDRESIECHEFDGLEKLDEADILVVSARRRYPRSEDLLRIRHWIESGKPTILIRTASHAFGERAKGTGYQPPPGHAAWNTFDRDALGAIYEGHYRDWAAEPRKRVRMWPEPTKLDHPILNGFKLGDFTPIGDKLYKYSDLDPAVEILLSARYPNEEAIYPVAWINEKSGKRVFYTSLGGLDEMAVPETQQLLLNAFVWASSPQEPVTVSVNPVKEATSDRKAPDDSHKSIVSADGIAVDLVASEPEVAQPSFIDFDERGRLWVVQYRQYPFPAGLEVKDKDRFWRTKYTDTPEPPGRVGYIPGKDMITIHEDGDGDGVFEHSKPFLEGLNMVTSFAWDADGVWVLQPPYLLFYYDKDKDDIPDGPPDVHLSGFGLEDTHSTVNSLTWGPDGWLYGAQGSTVTASVSVTGRNEPPIKSIGQLMWRYHPRKNIYEVFAEGGGNIWSCEFDSKGRLLAGANEGRKLGYHYMQGSYSRKNFGKHGDLSNDYAFGYFTGIEETGSQRVTTNLMVYEEGSLPARYSGAIFTANPLAGKVLASRKRMRGASFHSDPIGEAMVANDRWVRPVYLAPGPDGAVYVADWYDRQVNHMRSSEGLLSTSDGRIYRLRNADSEPGIMISLEDYSSSELVDTLSDEGRWYRETARRLLRQRKDRSVVPELEGLLRNEQGQVALEALWTLHSLGSFRGELRVEALEHLNPWVRLWSARLIGDEGKGSGQEYAKLASLAKKDTHVEVRQQLASTAKRLPPGPSANILKGLLKQDEDASDPYMPLMVWWALENLCSEDPDRAMELFDDASLFGHAMVKNHILGFLMKRFALKGDRRSLAYCAKLLNLASDPTSKKALLAGFEEAFEGRTIQGLPNELVDAISRSGGGSLAMGIRRNDPAAIEKAVSKLSEVEIEESERRHMISALGELTERGFVGIIIDQLSREDEATVMVALASLQKFKEIEAADAVLKRYSNFSDNLQGAARTMLSSRSEWSLRWLEAIQAGRISKESMPSYIVEGLARHDDQKINSLVGKLWGASVEVPSIDRDVEMAKLKGILHGAEFRGDRYSGRDTYLGRCAACHLLHSEGGEVGPDLTGYQRHDLDSLLLAISDPNAEVREGFENYSIKTRDGQRIVGFLADQDDRIVEIRPVGGQRLIVEKSDIVEMESLGGSLMPAGLLAGLDDKALVDLFAYLQSTQPLNIR